MRFAYTAEQELLRSSVRRFLQEKAPMAQVRRTAETPEGYDREVWLQLADQLGVHGLHIPEEYGGVGYSFAELAIVLEEMGRALLCSPFFASICLGANAILVAGTEEQKGTYLPEIASGRTTATLAHVEAVGGWALDQVDAVATRQADGVHRIDGEKFFVIDGSTADLLLVTARIAEADKVALFLVSRGADGVQVNRQPTMDQTRKMASVAFRGVQAALLGDAAAGHEAVTRVLTEAAICLSAEMLGGAERCLEMAVDYAKCRVQFGRPIGSFQAIQHKCADMLLGVQSARAVIQYAVSVARDGGPELAESASLAKSYLSDVYFQAAAENLQIHGGIGFTWEHDAHLYLKRAKTSAIMLGDAVYHREALARELNL